MFDNEQVATEVTETQTAYISFSTSPGVPLFTVTTAYAFEPSPMGATTPQGQFGVPLLMEQD